MNLDDLLRGPHLWRGYSGQRRQETVPTGFPELDRLLPGGGWPRGGVIEFFTERDGVGELSLWVPALMAASHDGGCGGSLWVVLVAPPFVPYAPAWAQCGINLERVLWVGERASQRDVLWAVEQAVRSGAATLVLAWIPNLGDAALRRLQLAAEEQDCGLVLFRPLAALNARSLALLSVRVSRVGRKTRIDILKCRGGRPAWVELDLPRVRVAMPRTAQSAEG